jgi:hypothetical protein
LHNAGVDFIKVHAAMGREAYFAIADETRRLRIRFADHLPRAIEPQESIEAGQATIEHLDRVADTAPFADRFTFTPTIVIERASLHVFGRPPSPYDRCISERSRKITDEMLAKYREMMTPEWARNEEKQLEAKIPLVPKMGRLLAGTDVGSSLLAPGFSLHQELDLLAARVPPATVLAASTRNPADILGISNAGRIAQGALAARGKFHDRAALDCLRPRCRAGAPLTSPPAARSSAPVDRRRRLPSRRRRPSAYTAAASKAATSKRP